MSKSNVIFVDFVNRCRLDGVKGPANAKLTNAELLKMSKRMDDIQVSISLCHPIVDSDILENLERELSHLQEVMEKAI